MFKALLIKHWVQLQTVRWVGFGLGVLLPFFLWTGAAAAKRGWLPIPITDYSLTTLFGEALPMLSVLMWWGLSVLFAAETFAGDRGSGTERFLLERPVPRGRVWRARVSATFGSIVLVVLGHSVYLLGLFAIVNDNTFAGGNSRILTACAVGLGLALLGTIGGMAAGEMLRTPIQAVMVGAVLALLPIGIAMLLAAVFQFAMFGDGVHLAIVVAPILPVAMILMSYRAGCLGEPDGRGRLIRGTTVFVVAVLATSTLFAAATPFVLRARSGGGWPEGMTTVGGRMVLSHGNWTTGSWAVDAATGETRFLAPPVEAAAWNEAGTRLAVVHGNGPLGSIAARRLDVFNADGKRLHSHPFVFAPGETASFVTWVGERILVGDRVRVDLSKLRLVDPENGIQGEVSFGGASWRLHGPTRDGIQYVHRLIRAQPHRDDEPTRYELSPLDLSTMQLGDPILTEDGEIPTYTRHTLSPSGRFWTGNYWDGEKKMRRSWVIDLETGERTDYPNAGIAGWMSGDRLVRGEFVDFKHERLIVQRSDGQVLASRSFETAIAVAISPDRERLLVARSSDPLHRPTWQMYQGSLVRATDIDGLWIWDLQDWTDMATLLDGLPGQEEWISWAGTDHLLATNGAGTARADAKPGSRWTRLLGSWP